MSRVMKNLSQFLSFKKLPIIPYHPMTHGLELFNEIPKQMTHRLCQESPKNWDRYLAPLLFSDGEVSQSSLGFAPFSLLYDRYVQGPLYGYVLDMYQRLEDTC